MLDCDTKSHPRTNVDAQTDGQEPLRLFVPRSGLRISLSFATSFEADPTRCQKTLLQGPPLGKILLVMCVLVETHQHHPKRAIKSLSSLAALAHAYSVSEPRASSLVCKSIAASYFDNFPSCLQSSAQSLQFTLSSASPTFHLRKPRGIA